MIPHKNHEQQPFVHFFHLIITWKRKERKRSLFWSHHLSFLLALKKAAHCWVLCIFNFQFQSILCVGGRSKFFQTNMLQKSREISLFGAVKFQRRWRRLYDILLLFWGLAKMQTHPGGVHKGQETGESLFKKMRRVVVDCCPSIISWGAVAENMSLK